MFKLYIILYLQTELFNYHKNDKIKIVLNGTEPKFLTFLSSQAFLLEAMQNKSEFLYENILNKNTKMAVQRNFSI